MQQESITSKIKAFLSKYNLYGKTFVLGFSGGYDSMCTLDILSKLGIKIIAAHYNHGWRKEADQEELNCRDFCKARNVEFYCELAPKDLAKTETAARNARYDFFQRVLEKYRADGIITAHNSDDNVETVIYRIIKGTGIIGLKGIQAVRGNIYRPLIYCTRSEIEEYCRKKRLLPNIDSSNKNTKYKRNFIRHEIIPLMEEINPEFKLAVSKLSELVMLDDEIISEYLNLIMSKIVKNNEIKIPEFLKLSKALKQKIIYTLLSNELKEYDFKRVNECLEFILENSKSKEEKKKSLTCGVWLIVNSTAAVIYRDQSILREEVIINTCGEYDFENWKLIIKETANRPKKFPPDSSYSAYVDFSQISFPLTLRFGNNRDIITPLGMNGKMVLKKYLSGRSVPQYKRKNVPVLTYGNMILWVPGVGLNSRIKVDKAPTHELKFIEKSSLKI